MAPSTREFAFEQLTKHEDLIRAAVGSNEATTRLRAIDTILFDVLAWEKTDVECERYVRANGFADYAFLDGKSIPLILEAKKSGATFLLPDREYPDTPVGFPLIAQECKEADAALRQALGYAAQLAARYIAITNGHQWIIALTWVNNQTVDERSVFIFESVDAIRAKFARFWDCFGPDGVRKNRAAALLLESRKAPAPSKLAERIVGYPASATRNLLVNQIEVVVAGVLEEVKREEGDIEFLTECYVEPESGASSLAHAKEMLMQRLEADERLASEVIDARDVSAMILHYDSERPIVVLGKVGHGKSTFLQYLRKVKAKDVLDKYFQIEIDFIDRPDSRDLVGKFVYDEIERQLRNNYQITLTDDNIVRGALHMDLDRFARSVEGRAYEHGSDQYKKAELEYIKGILADRHVFLEKVLHHFRSGRNSSIAIFFDNLDRRNEPIQEEAFLRASAIARDCAALVFVCLRPGTFYHSRKLGVLDSVAPKIINVVSPKTHALVERRIRFAKRIALGELPVQVPFGPTFSAELPRTAVFLECVAQSFHRSKKLSALFDQVSNGNARDMLSFVSQVLTSQHLDTGKIVNKFQRGGYQIAEHEVLRALLFGNYRHYYANTSQFINLFDIQRADAAEHFSRFIALDQLRRVPDGSPNYCFVSLEMVLRSLYQIGFSEEHAKDTIRFLFEHRYCEARVPVEKWGSEVKEIRITPLGRYHITELVRNFVYMDAVVVDTPILDDKARATILDVDHIKQRLERCEIFMAYLNECANAIGDIEFQQAWKEMTAAVLDNVSRIKASIAF
jgi:hypothetical protein